MRNPNLNVSSSTVCSNISNQLDFETSLNSISLIPQDSFDDILKNISVNIDKINKVVFGANVQQIVEKRNNDSDLVRDLVIERFRDSFKKIALKKRLNVIDKTVNDLKTVDNVYDNSCMPKINNTSEQNLSQSSETAVNVSSEESWEYDEFKFLEAALGDELTKYSNTSKSNIILSEDQSIGTSNISTLISHSSQNTVTSTKYNNESSKSYSFASLIEENRRQQQMSLSYLEANENKILGLVMERAVQEEVIEQIYKALNYCSKTKEFYASPEHIEAERALLISICRKEMLTKEISRLEYECIEKTFINLGTVTISSINLFPKESSSDTTRDFNQWFICILRCEETLLASQPVLVNGNGTIAFNETFKFEDLTPDFEIELSLYSMRIRNNVRVYSHESKFHLKEERIVCPTLKFKKKKKKVPALKPVNPRPSAFHFWGRTKIGLANCTKDGYFQLSDVPRSSTVLNFVNIKLKSSVDLNECKEGFLSVGLIIGEVVNWNRRWCSLKGSKLCYWNSPDDADDKDPLEVLDLCKCLTPKIDKVERSICARPRTLVMDLVCKNSDGRIKSEYCVRKYFLSADTLSDMKEWDKSLNSVLRTLRDWHCMAI